MSVLRVDLKFKDGFKGQMVAKNTQVAVGIEEGELRPYDMMLGALASCLYSTFLDVIEKKKITFDEANVTVTGEKREQIPATLKWVKVVIEVKGASEEKGVLRAAELSKKYCSVYETISKVAEIELETRFI
ncbi:MAG: OsmC family protein [Clostridia bacterium]|nr:OsmC family protein [Clostridia bacterium]MBN2883521.1 OsmC family protein [Clostridia bacterium]